MNEIATADTSTAKKLGLEHRVRLGAPVSNPLVLLVHGRAGNFDNMLAFRRCVPDNWSILVPQAYIHDEELGGWSWWEVNGTTPPLSERPVQAAQRLDTFLSAARQYYGLAPCKVLALGFSQGGALLSHTLQHKGEIFDGVALLASFVIEDAAAPTPVSGRSPEIFIAHGSQDKIVPIEKAYRSRDYLLTRNYHVTFIEDPVAHKVGVRGMRALSDWLGQFA